MTRNTVIELTNYLNTNYSTPYTEARYSLQEPFKSVIRIYVYDIDSEILWISEWEKLTHSTFRAMLYNMKCTPINLAK